jgi:hypothetical protein
MKKLLFVFTCIFLFLTPLPTAAQEIVANLNSSFQTQSENRQQYNQPYTQNQSTQPSSSTMPQFKRSERDEEKAAQNRAKKALQKYAEAAVKDNMGIDVEKYERYDVDINRPKGSKFFPRTHTSVDWNDVSVKITIFSLNRPNYTFSIVSDNEMGRDGDYSTELTAELHF